MGNCPNTDILCSNAAGTKFAHIQVKTFRPGDRTCTVGMKAEHDYGKNFFWVLSGIPEPRSPKAFEYYIIPSEQMARRVRAGFEKWRDTPGQRGQKRDETNTIRTVHLPPKINPDGWSIEEYRNRWNLIEQCVGVAAMQAGRRTK